ncbi:MAG: hypothetical protein AAGG51_16105 [Cyanobacteria bacterium P01_G01_bin.54]
MLNVRQSATATVLSLAFGLTGLAPLLLVSPSAAQRLPRISRGSIPAGTTLPTDAIDEETEKILLAPKEEEPMPLTLVLAANVRDGDGRILLAQGTEIVGYLEVIEGEADEGGVRFIGEEILVGEDRLLLEGNSELVTTTETVTKGADGGDILEGAAIGAGAATVISILTGDNSVSIGEVLAGGAIGALGGLIFGKNKVDLYSVDPNEDLDVTLSETLDL